MAKNRKIQDTSGEGDRRREVLGVLGLGAGVFLLVAMISLQADRLLMGPFGRASATLFYGIAGVCGYILTARLVVAAIRLLLVREPVVPWTVAVGVAIGVVALATLIHLAASGYRVAGHGPGGAVGEHLAEILRAVISTAGTALLALVGLVVAIVVATPLRMRYVLGTVGSGIWTAVRAGRTAAVAVARFWRDVFLGILPHKDDTGDTDDAIDIEDIDVLEISDDERVAEPVIIDRTEP